MQPCGVFNSKYEQDIAIVRTRLQWGLLIAFLIFLAVFPFFATIHLLYLFIMTGITVITLLGLQILTGYCGQISLGHAAFMGVGAYASFILFAKAGLPFWVSLPTGGIMAAAIGMLFGAPSLRVKGLYLAMATIAAHFIIIYVIHAWDELTGGGLGLTAPKVSIGGFVFDTDFKYYYLVMVLTVFMTYFAKNLVRTRVGRAFVAVRDNDLAAEVMGINIFGYKLLAFGIGCFYAGIAGALWAHYTCFVHTEYFDIIDAIWYIGMLVVGGLGSIMGAIYGAVFFRIIEEVTIIVSPILGEAFPFISEAVLSGVGLMLWSLIIILFLIYEPRGINHRWLILKAAYRLHPYSY